MGQELAKLREAAGRPMRHQVFDVPVQVEAEVQEYRLYHGVCGHCRKKHKSVLPAGVPRGQIGPRALALVGLLGTAYHLTQPKIRDLLAQVLGVRFSVGAISQAHGLVAQALKEPARPRCADVSASGDARVLRRHRGALAGALGLSALPGSQPGNLQVTIELTPRPNRRGGRAFGLSIPGG